MTKAKRVLTSVRAVGGLLCWRSVRARSLPARFHARTHARAHARTFPLAHVRLVAAFNSWDRLPYVTDVREAGRPSTIPAVTKAHRNFIVAKCVRACVRAAACVQARACVREGGRAVG